MNPVDLSTLKEVHADIRAISFILFSTIYTLNEAELNADDLDAVATFFTNRLNKNSELLQEIIKNEQKNRA